MLVSAATSCALRLPPCASLDGDLAVLVPYFNPLRVAARAANLHRCLQSLADAGVPAFVGELVFPGGVPLDTRPFPAMVSRGVDVLWQKERLLNRLVADVPRQFRKVAWVDADVVFADAEWYASTSRLLDVYPVVQCFDRVHHLDEFGGIMRTVSGIRCWAEGHESCAYDLAGMWPGTAWGARRDLIEAYGLFDVMVCGGGDTMFALAAFGRFEHWHVNALPPGLQSAWLAWAIPFFVEVRGQVGHVSGDAMSLWHGDYAVREYVGRLALLNEHDYDPARDVESDERGILRWSGRNPALARDVAAYFSRREAHTSTEPFR